MRVAVVGAGFVGVATGVGLKKHGHEVTFIDTDKKVVDKLRELGFQATTSDDYEEITTEISMISVQTPVVKDKVKLDFIESASKDIGHRLKSHDEYHVVVVRSTVPPRTTREVIIPALEKESGKKAGKDFGVCTQPEYLREATVNQDFERPWHILIGELDKESGDLVEELYSTFDVPISRCLLEEAEIQKYIHNAYNAVKIAFFNEMRIACKEEGWDAEKIFHATAESSEAVWNPVYGMKDLGAFSGTGLPEDTQGLLAWGDSSSHTFPIVKAVIAANLNHEKTLGKSRHVRINHLAQIDV